ncbi:MAG: hypothetical protein ACREMD_03800 [Gemmatimonadota bacterium]
MTAQRNFLIGLFCLVAIGCGSPGEGGAGEANRSESDTMEAAVITAEVAFANHCSATSPDIELVTPAEAAEWSESETPSCVVFEDIPEYYGGFDPLGLEGPCGAVDSVPPWESSKELYAVVSASGTANYTLHIATRIEETDDERCVGCYPEESGCTGASTFRELSRDASLTMPEGGGRRVVPLTEIQGLDFEREVLSIELAVELLVGDSVVARDTLVPVWARCC